MSLGDPLHLADGYYLALATDFLYREGILRRLALGEESVETLAAPTGLDGEILGQVLDFVHRHDPRVLARGEDGRYRLILDAGGLLMLSYTLDKYLGGYGPCLADLGRALRRPSEAGTLIDGRRFAAAFSLIDGASFPAMPRVIGKFGVTRLLDLGCGSGGLLLAMAEGESAFRGWGLEPNSHMRAVAESRAAERGLSHRLTFVAGDALSVSADLPAGVAEAAEAASGVSLFNEFFHGGPDRAVGLLRSLRALLPGRLLFVADYYGRLGHRVDPSAPMTQTLVHDLVQAASGQGVPPPTGEAWDEVYRAGGCRRLDRVDGSDRGLNWFIDTLRLDPPE